MIFYIKEITSSENVIGQGTEKNVQTWEEKEITGDWRKWHD